jgi:hypothetical protein
MTKVQTQDVDSTRQGSNDKRPSGLVGVWKYFTSTHVSLPPDFSSKESMTSRELLSILIHFPCHALKWTSTFEGKEVTDFLTKKLSKLEAHFSDQNDRRKNIMESIGSDLN